jgi:RNA polymerase sigma-70 factor (ECF subfamily)
MRADSSTGLCRDLPTAGENSGTPGGDVPEAPDAWQAFLARLRSGESAATRQFCDEFGPSLHKLAAAQMPDGLRRRVGAEDVVQSACRTFLRRARDRQFELADSQGLWQLMRAITVAKVREQARFHLRQRRGLQREAAAPNDSGGNWHVAGREPAPDAAVAFADELRHLLQALDGDERQVLKHKLAGRTNAEAAVALGMSERSVRRLLGRLRTRWERALAEP